MSKLANLQASLEKAAGRSTPQTASPPVAATARPAPDTRPGSRVGKVHIGAYLPAGFKSSLRLVQAQTGEDTQTLIARALNELFRGHNVPVVDAE